MPITNWSIEKDWGWQKWSDRVYAHPVFSESSSGRYPVFPENSSGNTKVVGIKVAVEDQTWTEEDLKILRQHGVIYHTGYDSSSFALLLYEDHGKPMAMFGIADDGALYFNESRGRCHITSLEPLIKLIEDAGWEFTKNGISNLNDLDIDRDEESR